MLDGLMWAGIGITCGVIGSSIVHKIQGVEKVLAEVKEEDNDEIKLGSPVVLKTADHNTTPQMRIGFIDAMNGRILEINTAIPNNHNHYDWKTEMYVVPEGQKLSEAIAVVMLMKGLEK
jgi:hypothetical protein